MSQRSSNEIPPQATQANPEQKPGALSGSNLPSNEGLEREPAQRQVARLEALHALSLEVVAQHEPDQVIARALELAVRILDAEASGFWQVLKQGYLLRAVHGASDVLKNEATLRTFLRYSYEQGLSKRLLQPQELFAPESLEAFKI